MAPEIYAYQKFDGAKADVFSLGVLIFILLTGFPPFTTPNASDKCFQLMYYGKLEWLLAQWKLNDTISADCRSLLGRIFCHPKKRIALRDMLQHPWLALDLDEVDKELARFSTCAEDSSLSAGDTKEQSPTASPAPAPAPPPAAAAPAPAPAPAPVTRKQQKQRRASVSKSTEGKATGGKKHKSMMIIKKKRLSKGKARKKSASKVSEQGQEQRRRPYPWTLWRTCPSWAA